MHLTIVGSRAGIGVSDEASAGYLLTEGDDVLLVECGPGVVTRLGRYIALGQLVGVVVSHMHFDTYGDLFALANARHNSMSDPLINAYISDGRVKDRQALPVYLSPGKADPFSQQLATIARGHFAPFHTALSFRDYRPGAAVEIGPFTIHPVGPMAHDPEASFGFRVSSGDAVIGYSGETAPCEAVEEVAHDADLFLCDAMGITARVRTEQTRRHLSADEAGQVASRAGARQLVLTHLIDAPQRWYRAMTRAARAHYAGPVTIARPGRVFDITMRDAP